MNIRAVASGGGGRVGRPGGLAAKRGRQARAGAMRAVGRRVAATDTSIEHRRKHGPHSPPPLHVDIHGVEARAPREAGRPGRGRRQPVRPMAGHPRPPPSPANHAPCESPHRGPRSWPWPQLRPMSPSRQMGGRRGVAHQQARKWGPPQSPPPQPPPPLLPSPMPLPPPSSLPPRQRRGRCRRAVR